MSTPLISVVIPVHNGADTLIETLGSLESQTWKDFEVLLVFNGCTDQSLELANRYQIGSNLNIHSIELEESGIVGALNAGLKYAKGNFIARLDADDLCFPNRLETQLELLNRVSNIAVCGSRVEFFGDSKSKNNTENLMNIPISNGEIHCELLFSNPLPHPSVMINRSIIDGGLLKYDMGYFLAEDYALWVKLAKKGYQFRNIEDPLIRYRLHENQTTKSYRDLRIESCSKIQSEIFKHYCGDLEVSEINLYQNWAKQEPFPCVQDLYRLFGLVKKLSEVARGVSFLNKEEWVRQLYRQWQRLLYTHQYMGIRVKILSAFSNLYFKAFCSKVSFQ